MTAFAMLRAHGASRSAAHVGRERCETHFDDRAIELLIGIHAEHLRKELRLNPAQQHICVGHGERSAAPITRRPRIGPGRLGPYAQTRPVEAHDGPAAGRDAMDAQHGGAHSNAGDLGVEYSFEFAGKMAHIGGRAAHVETYDLGPACGLRRPRHTDDTACRTREYRVLALKVLRLGQPAGALHEQQRYAGQGFGELSAIALQDRGEVGIHHRGVAARHEFHQGAYAVRDGNLRVTDIMRQRRGGA